MKLVTIHRAFNSADAQLVRSRLEAANFHAAVMNENSTLYLGTAVASGGILVQVPENEAEDAREFLNAPANPEE
ncbi:MAG TPA: DUF2007 domain-containing protein [Verrucomicrobiota bacterium]|nr:DUF2007 domain-containing protein [Verrucomicrobiota bacterium]